jgi:hypothetical protein
MNWILQPSLRSLQNTLSYQTEHIKRSIVTFTDFVCVIWTFFEGVGLLCACWLELSWGEALGFTVWSQAHWRHYAFTIFYTSFSNSPDSAHSSSPGSVSVAWMTQAISRLNQNCGHGRVFCQVPCGCRCLLLPVMLLRHVTLSLLDPRWA